MSSPISEKSDKVVLITGGAQRIGASITHHLHAQGMRIALHYRNSAPAANALASALNAQRPDSVYCLQADLLDTAQLPSLVERVLAHWGQLDVLINNASAFYPTPLTTVSEPQWDELLGSNLKAPFFLSQAAAASLDRQQGCIINLLDIHGERPLKDYPIYSIAKAGLIMLTKALARELGPRVRVNGIAPGPILWPESGLDEANQQRIIAATALKRLGEPDDIARTAGFLIQAAAYITGQVITVDGGRSLGNP